MAGLETSEVGLAILPSRLAVHGSRERRLARGTGSARLETRLAKPGSARMPFRPRGAVSLALCGGRFGGLRRGSGRCRFPGGGLGVLLATGLLIVLRSLLPRGNDVGFGLRFLRPRLGSGLRRDFVAAALEDFQRDLELLRLERPQVELAREVDEVPFLLGQV